MSTSQNISLLADKALAPAKPTAADLPQVKGWVRGGFLIILLGIGGFLLWAHTLQLAGGAYAGGMVRLSEDKQTVSHVEGGIIRELNVDEGQSVEAGAALWPTRVCSSSILLQRSTFSSTAGRIV